MNREDLKEIKEAEKELLKLQKTMHEVDKLTSTVDGNTIASIQIANSFTSTRVPGEDLSLLLGFYSQILHKKVNKKEQEFNTMLKSYTKK